MARPSKLKKLAPEQVLTPTAITIDQLYSRWDAILEALPEHVRLFQKIERKHPLTGLEIKEVDIPPEGYNLKLPAAPGVKLVYTGEKLVVFREKPKR